MLNETPSRGGGRLAEYVTVKVADQLFGLPIARVRDVFVPDRLTRVPLAPPEVAGVLNLRGRIVTAIDMRNRLGLPARTATEETMAVGVDCGGESYALLVDSVGDVVKLPDEALEANPVNLDRRLAAVCAGIHQLEGQLLVSLDVDRVLGIGADAAAA
ncbi:MAG: chemotaxis protein CheW [Variibacter sp.]|nr:chemotaxis protein CheW [Variibacter sp.]